MCVTICAVKLLSISKPPVFNSPALVLQTDGHGLILGLPFFLLLSIFPTILKGFFKKRMYKVKRTVNNVMLNNDEDLATI